MAPISFLTFNRNKLLRSPTPTLLRTNNPPSEQDIVSIRHAIAQVEDKLSKKCRASPSSDYCPHVKFIQIHKAILSPCRRLPTELVVEIFLYCHESPVNPKRNVVPWKLTHISHRWRIIALNTPSLWKDLPPMRLGSLEKQQLKRQIACLSTLLTLSGNCRLTFFLAKIITPTVDDEILSMLFEHSERWEKLSLAICEDVCSLFTRVKGRLSSLRSLRLLLTTTGNLTLDMFEVAPKLREVSLGSLTWPGIVKLPWNQITNFTEDASRTDHIITVFNSSTESLQRLNFITDQSWALFDGTAVIRPTILPKLTCLALQTPFETGLKSLLDAVTVPVLKELVLKLFTAQSLSREVVDLIERSRCSLRKLTIHTSAAQNIDQILALTPFLTVLDINDPPQNLIYALTNISSSLGAQQWTLLPFLQTLTARVSLNYIHLSKLKRLARIRCDLVLETASGTEMARCIALREFNIACPLPAQTIDQNFDVWAVARFEGG